MVGWWDRFRRGAIPEIAGASLIQRQFGISNSRRCHSAENSKFTANWPKSVETDCQFGDRDWIESVLTDPRCEPGQFIPGRMSSEA